MSCPGTVLSAELLNSFVPNDVRGFAQKLNMGGVSGVDFARKR
jgi:hypothetical protein